MQPEPSADRDPGATDHRDGTGSTDNHLPRRAFIGGLVTAGAAGVLGSATAQDDGQDQRPGWLRARDATIYIEAFGDYSFPGIEAEGTITGSGAIVEESGIALSNAHVVSGADTLRVFVGEDRQQSYNAQIVGLSDCADLAVIRILGDGFPSLSWRGGQIFSGLNVTAHGFPVNGTRVASTRGTVSRVGQGETEWASVDSILEHTATIAPGSSGGPLVDDNGNLVGINYAGSQFSQYYAIARDIARSVTGQLQAGENVDYLGMSTLAVETGAPMTPDGITRGLHLITVDPGTPAWNAGLRPGDRIVRIRGSRAVRDETPLPTKEFYCDVLRTQGADAVYPVQVSRALPGGQQGGLLLEGEINGRPLQVVQGGGGDGTGGEPRGEYEQFGAITDDTGTIRTEVPTAWADVDGAPSSLGPSLIAAPSVEDFLGTWTTPGVLFIVSDQFGTDTDAVLDQLEFPACQVGGRQPFESGTLTGQSQRLTDCGDTGTALVNIAALPEDESYMVVLQAQIVGSRDLGALSRAVVTLTITGDPTEVGAETPPQTATPNRTPGTEQTDGS
ncbi:S1C family serine protease [Haloglomus litoreum]|uniref:S1C family serine protease n=1 Tax=Haloglomus litoreum TaxID=3034026 RepID=UPI0023E7ED55|nr:trypsin-like peptidase domain-containing protein [Haloglomus sp. DT116]